MARGTLVLVGVVAALAPAAAIADRDDRDDPTGADGAVGPSTIRREGMPAIDPARTACLLDAMWPAVQGDGGPSFEDQLADHLGALGNAMGDHLSLLSKNLVGLHVDGRGQRARLSLGGGSGRHLVLRLDGDVHFTDGLARVKARLDLGVAGHAISLELPEFDMSPESLAGQQYVELRLPLLRRSF